MPEVIFNGPEGRLEGRYQPGKDPNAPIAIVLHPHPEFGGTMNNQIVYNLFYMFAKRGFSVLTMSTLVSNPASRALARTMAARVSPLSLIWSSRSKSIR